MLSMKVFKRRNPKSSYHKEEVFFLFILFCIYRWIVIKFIVIIIHNLCNSNYYALYLKLHSCCSVPQLYLTLGDPMGYSTPGLPVPHYLPKFPQVLVHWVSNAIQPSRHLPPPSPFAFYLSQHLFYWVSCSHWVAKVLELQLQHQSFQWVIRVDFLYNWLVWSSCCPRDSQESSPTLQFESINLALSLLYGPALTSVHDYYYYYHILARANTGTLLGNRIFADIIKFQTRPTWTKVDPNSVWLMSLFTYFSF